MATTLLAAAVLSACPVYAPCASYEPSPVPTCHRPCGPWFYQWFYVPTSPWNAAVAELQARGPSRSSDRYLPPATAAQLYELAARRAELYAGLRAVPKGEKDELRRLWMAATEELDKARLRAAREARR